MVDKVKSERKWSMDTRDILTMFPLLRDTFMAPNPRDLSKLELVYRA